MVADGPLSGRALAKPLDDEVGPIATRVTGFFFSRAIRGHGHLDGFSLRHPSYLVDGDLNIRDLRAPSRDGTQVVSPIRRDERIPATAKSRIPLVGCARHTIELLMIERVGRQLLGVDRLCLVLHDCCGDLSLGHSPGDLVANAVAFFVGDLSHRAAGAQSTNQCQRGTGSSSSSGHHHFTSATISFLFLSK